MNKTNFKKLAVLLLTVILVLAAIPFSGITASAAGKTYYVSASGTKNAAGTESSPLSLEGINAVTLKGGDTVLFKRGDVFYGRFVTKVDRNNATDSLRVNVDTYGEGELPILSMVKIVGNVWTDNGDGFYKCNLSNENNYTGISNSFLTEENYANVGFLETQNGVIYGERYKDAESCTSAFSFYCDYNNIYVKSDVNPYTVLGEIKMPIHSGPVIRHNGFINIKNLHIKYGGYGISASYPYANSLTVENCIIEYLGGQDIDAGEGFTRAGNGIELYNRGENITVRNNIFRQIFDVGFTCQGYGWDTEETVENEDGTTTTITEAVWENITVTNNIFSYCTQAFEIWSGAKSENSGIKNLLFTNNLCIGQGEGWTYSFRANGGYSHVVTDILTYGYKSPVLDMTLTGNTYFHSKPNTVFFSINNYTDEKFLDRNYVVSDNNYFYHLDANASAYLKAISGINGFVENTNFVGWQAKGQDTSSVFTAIGNNLSKYSTMQKVAMTSLNFNDIADTAKDAGVIFNLEYDESATTAKALENNISVAQISGGNVSFDAKLKGDYCNVTVTATPEDGKQLKADGLKYTLNGEVYPIVKRVGAANGDGTFNKNSESQCNTFEFNLANNATNVVITADFVDNGSENIAVIGTSVNEALVSMRFRSRVSRKLVINGKEYTVKYTGTLLFKAAQTDLDAAWENIAYGKINAKNIKTTQLYDRTDNYYEYVCHINYGTANSEFLDDTYYAYAYAVYENQNGDTVRIYSDGVAHSYQEVLSASDNVIA